MWQNDAGLRGGDRPAEGTEAGASGDDLGAPFSLSALCEESVLTHHRHRLVVVLPDGNRAHGSVAGPPLLVYTADANSGLCIGWSCADALGAWGPSATNKRHRVYTCALLATTIRVHIEG